MASTTTALWLVMLLGTRRSFYYPAFVHPSYSWRMKTDTNCISRYYLSSFLFVFLLRRAESPMMSLNADETMVTNIIFILIIRQF